MTSSEPISQQEPKRKKRRLWLKIGVPVILVPVLAVTLWVWSTLGFVYSSGERTGYVQKMSHKGWVCKTWEGELAMSPVPGSPPTLFNFTIRDDSVAKALELAAGHQVTLTYAQHKNVPTTCFGETEYFVEGFRIDR
jgi:hypothetical protein